MNREKFPAQEAEKLPSGGARSVKREDFPVAEAEKKLKYTFKDKNLLITAFTHKSLCGRLGTDNDRMEFLGDAVLELAITENLYRGKNALQAGDMTKRRQKFVSREPLERAADKLGIARYLMYSGNARDNAGKKAKSSLVESVIAAIYLDGDGANGDGYKNAKKFIDENVEFSANENAKGDLQEYLQKRGLPLPVYRLLSAEGKDNDRTFVCEAAADGKSARGTGRKKQKAEAEAAKNLLDLLQNIPF